ncbi:response regulator transcription factor [Streptomyces zhihengii]
MVVSVIIADDSEIVRRGLGDILASAADVHVVGQAWDGRSAVDMARRTSPDVALMDIRMPGMDGLTATRELRALPVPPAILILTSFGGDAYVDEALRAGAHGFLLKDSPRRNCCGPCGTWRGATASSTLSWQDPSWNDLPSETLY